MSDVAERVVSLCDSLGELLSHELSSGSSAAAKVMDLVSTVQDGSRDPRFGQILARLRNLRGALDHLGELVRRDQLSSLRREAEKLAKESADGRLGTVLAALVEERVATLTLFCEAVLDRLLAATAAQRGVVVFYHQGSTEAAAQRGFGDLEQTLQELKLSHTVLRQALAQRQGVLYDDAASEPGLLSARSLDLRSILAAPLIQGEHLVGAIYLDNLEIAGAFSRADLELLQGVGKLTMFVLHHSRLLPSRARSRVKISLETDAPFGRIVAHDPAMLAVLDRAARAARTPSSVLIEGETGTGKELVAEGIHFASSRREGPFLAVNCGAIPAGLVESQLFGHERGAFTGATQRHRGYFEQAQGGTLFLDEIGELPIELQARLLRLLREKEYQRLGGEKLQHTDVRIIAATSRTLQDEVSAGRFREDLFYRLNIIDIRVPSLRDRRGDIAPLAAHFLEVFVRRAGQEMEIDPAVVEMLEGYDFPGNVAELENMIERAVVLAEDHVIRVGDLPQPILERLDLGPDGLLRALARTPCNPAELRRQGKEVTWALAKRELDLIERLRSELGMAETARLFQMTRQNLYVRLKKLKKNLADRKPGPSGASPSSARNSGHTAAT